MSIESNLKKGTVEILLLAVLMEEDMYGYQICQELALRSNGLFTLQEGSAYPILYRLSEKGLIFFSDILRIKSEAVSVPLCGTRGSYIHVKKNFIFTFRRTSL